MKGQQSAYVPPPGPPPPYQQQPQQYQPQQYQPQQYQQPNGIPPEHAHNSYYASFGHLYGAQPHYNRQPGFRHSYGGQPSQPQQMNYHQQPNFKPSPQGHYPQPNLSPYAAQDPQYGRHSPQTQSHGRRSSHSSRPSQSLSPQPNQYRPSSASSQGSFGGAGTGFGGLPSRIEVWCAQHGGFSSDYHMELGAQPFGEVMYAAKLGGDKTKFKRGIYTSEGAAIAEAVDKSFFSSKSILKVHGFETEFEGGINTSSGAVAPFQAPRNGRTESFEWRRKKSGGGLRDKLSRAMSSKMGNWELCLAGSSEVIATWTTGESNGMEKNKSMGVLEFHGQAAMGDTGDTFHSLAILAMLRIVHLRFISEVASSVAV